METCGVYDDSCISNVSLKYEPIPARTSEVLDSLWAPNSSPSFQGSGSLVNFEEDEGENSKKRTFSTHTDNKVENCNEGMDVCFHRPEKKRRLMPEQVQFLEKNFEVENKLEPDRKVQLAKEVGLQPRQVAIWFQNRRARYKTKVLEKDYDSLKASYDKLKADYDALYAENEKLKNEVHFLSQKLLLRENGKPKREPCDPISPLDFQPKDPSFSPEAASDVVPVVAFKHEEAASSARSDVFDPDSPHYADGNHVEPANSSHAFEPDVSDFSQDGDDSFLQPNCFPKLEAECCDDLQPNSCNLGFPVQDQGTWFWQY